MQKTENAGTEEAGRWVRYSFFDEIAIKTGSNKIATAHNSNDNCETILLNIIRGSGISGLKGIDPAREIYIRPLIDCQREEIEGYCMQNNLNPKIDESNLETKYARNKIRNICIPYIQKEFNLNIVKTLNRLSEIAKEELNYTQKIVQDVYQDICIESCNSKIILDLRSFNTQELVIKRRIILYTINKLLGNTVGIEKINIDDIITLCENNIGNKYLSPIKNLEVWVKNKKIEFIKLL